MRKVVDRDDLHIYFVRDLMPWENKTVEIPCETVKWIKNTHAEMTKVNDYLRSLNFTPG